MKWPWTKRVKATPTSVVQVIRGRYDLAQTTPDNMRHWANADFLSANSSIPHLSVGDRLRFDESAVRESLLRQQMARLPQVELKERCVWRYNVSRGFWGGRGARKMPVASAEERKRHKGQEYSRRLAGCGQTVNVFQAEETLDTRTGEVEPRRRWVRQADVPASVLLNIFDPGEPKRPRRSLLARSLDEVLEILSAAAGRPVGWVRPEEGEDV